VDLKIKGRKAIVAGGSAGLGHASAVMLAREGVELFVSARNEERLVAAARAIENEHGAKVTPVVADHGTAAGRDALALACPEPDILVITCSPPSRVSDYSQLEPDEWRESLEITTIGPIELMRRFVPGMVERKLGRVVNIGTVAARHPTQVRMMSGAGRAALCNYTLALAKTVARHNVTVNNILPGFFRTAGVERLMDVDAFLADQAERVARGEPFKTPVGKEVPANRLGDPEELAAFCALLCSDYAGFSIGQSILMDGGTTGTMF
jgi:3-oxoacyl-[acyl-carrier protein] reductase